MDPYEKLLSPRRGPLRKNKQRSRDTNDASNDVCEGSGGSGGQGSATEGKKTEDEDEENGEDKEGKHT